MLASLEALSTQSSPSTRTGDGFADILFGFVYARVLKSVEEQLLHLGVLSHFPIVGPGTAIPEEDVSSPFFGPSWMDDTAVCILGDSADSLERKTMVATSVLLDTCRSYGMTPNLQPGKTAIVAAFRGRNSRKIRAKYFGPNSPRTMAVLTDTGLEHVALTGSYAHLGGVFQHDSHSRQDVRRRVGIAHKAFQHHRRLIFHNRALQWKTRKELVQSLVMSKLFFGIESWAFQDALLSKTFHASVIKLYKRLLRIKHDAAVSDAEVLCRVELPSPSTLLRQANASDLKDPVEHFAQWMEIIIHAPKFWKRLVSRAVQHDSQQNRNLSLVTEFHKNVLRDQWHRLRSQRHQPDHLLVWPA